MSGERHIKISAGVKMQTDPQLYHTWPDVVIYVDRPKRVFVFEVAVSHIKNLKLQKKIKRVRYEKNSTIPVNHQNYDDVPKSYNLCEALGKIYKCAVTLGILIFGAF